MAIMQLLLRSVIGIVLFLLPIAWARRRDTDEVLKKMGNACAAGKDGCTKRPEASQPNEFHVADAVPAHGPAVDFMPGADSSFAMIPRYLIKEAFSAMGIVSPEDVQRELRIWAVEFIIGVVIVTCGYLVRNEVLKRSMRRVSEETT
mmetsp:Transcript_66334/g.104926  ORF Transcript_66334/g.104926 Transcript_66334/m.104926 type:complete len:147 (-) Transcript_66334:53-493(-)